MTSTNERQKLVRTLSDKEYRDAFVSEKINSRVALQVRANRIARELNQKELGALCGMKQNQISRLEDPDYGPPNLNTLMRLAAAFDCALVVKFAPFSELVEWTLAEASLEVPSFNNDHALYEDAISQTAKRSTVYRRSAVFGGSITSASTRANYEHKRKVVAR